MALNFGALGAFAGGLNSGIERGTALADRAQRMRMAREDQDFQNEQRQRQRVEWQRMDADRAAMEEANRAASEAFKTGAGSDEDKALGALTARTQALAKAGAVAPWLESWRATADMRARARAKAFDAADAAFAATQDPSVYVKPFSLLEDGMEIVSAKLVRAPAPAKMTDVQRANYREPPATVQLTLRNQTSGKDVAHELALDQFAALMQKARDPAAARALEAQYALKRWETEEKARGEGLAEKARLPAKLAHEEAKAEHEQAAIAARNKAEHGQIAARGAQERRTNAEKLQVLAPDAQLVQSSRDKDGKVTTTVVAEGKPKKTGEEKRLRDDALQRLVINSGIGTTDPLTGQARGNEDSNKVALAASMWLDANPAMSELEAVNIAIKEYRERQKNQRRASGSVK